MQLLPLPIGSELTRILTSGRGYANSHFDVRDLGEMEGDFVGELFLKGQLLLYRFIILSSARSPDLDVVTSDPTVSLCLILPVPAYQNAN